MWNTALIASAVLWLATGNVNPLISIWIVGLLFSLIGYLQSLR